VRVRTYHRATHTTLSRGRTRIATAAALLNFGYWGPESGSVHSPY